MNNRFSRLLHFYGVAVDYLSLNAIYLTSWYWLQDKGGDEPTYVYFWIGLNLAWFLTSKYCYLYTETYLSSFELFYRRSFRTYLYWLALILTFLFFTRQQQLSQLLVIGVLFSQGIMMLLNRLLFFALRRYMREKAMLTRKVLILGYNDTAKKLTSYLEEEDSLASIVGYCEEPGNIRELTKYPVLAGLDDALNVSFQHSVHEIYTTLAPEQNQSIYRLMKEAERACIRVHFIPDLRLFMNRNYHVQFLGDMPVLAIRKEPLEDSVNQLKKRVLDIVISLLVIVFVLSWLVPLLSLLIYIESPGPVFFKQLRSGRNNTPFWCLKFRSMKMNKDANAKQATRNDSRITKIGRIIRKTSLDEFPQFINVLRGDMSLVGPRPHMLRHTDDYSSQLDDFMVRHFVKPGITGWAQVNGFRGETKTLADMQGRIERDVWYLENWSLWLDMKILFLTAYNMVKGEKNAY